MADPLEEFRAALEQSGGDELKPIGVPEGFTRTETREAGEVGGGGWGAGSFGLSGSGRPRSRGGMVEVEVPPRYMDGHQFTPAQLAPPARADLQARLVSAGLIQKGSRYFKGEWDDVSVTAFEQLLALANRSGLTWQQELTVLENTAVENRREQFQAPQRLRSDPATLRQNARAFMRKTVGRDPTDQELGQFTAQMAQFDEQAYGAQVGAERAAFMAEESGQAAPAADMVDPEARFLEYLQQQYRPEIQMREGIADLAQSRENLMGSVLSLDRMIGV